MHEVVCGQCRLEERRPPQMTAPGATVGRVCVYKAVLSRCVLMYVLVRCVWADCHGLFCVYMVEDT